MLDPRNINPQIFIDNSKSYGISPYNCRSLLSEIVGNNDLNPSSWQKKELISKALAERTKTLPSLELVEVQKSKIDNFQKLLFRTHDNLFIETVVIPLLKENCVSICLSSQIGCVMGCDFCATAKMKNRRNLDPWEIINQMQQARQLVTKQGKKITGAVFMGMGEPFLNYKNVMIAAEHFCFPSLNAISAKAITISTVGLTQEIERFTKEKRPFRLSISIGSAFDEKRKQLVPVAARTPIKDVISSAATHASSRNDRVMIAYVCISNENIFEEDAKELARIINGTPVRLDLIDVTDTSGKYKKPSEEEIKQFRGWLNLYLKQPVARRYSGGADINAACGTLAGK